MSIIHWLLFYVIKTIFGQSRKVKSFNFSLLLVLIYVNLRQLTSSTTRTQTIWICILHKQSSSDSPWQPGGGRGGWGTYCCRGAKPIIVRQRFLHSRIKNVAPLAWLCCYLLCLEKPIPSLLPSSPPIPRSQAGSYNTRIRVLSRCPL